MNSTDTKPISPDDVVEAIHKAFQSQPIIRAMLGQGLFEDLCVKVLRNLFGVDFSKEAEDEQGE